MSEFFVIGVFYFVFECGYFYFVGRTFIGDVVRDTVHIGYKDSKK